MRIMQGGALAPYLAPKLLHAEGKALIHNKQLQMVDLGVSSLHLRLIRCVLAGAPLFYAAARRFPLIVIRK